VLDYYQFNVGRDNGEFAGSEDQRNFDAWGGGQDAREGQL
jgi:phenol hydroxylase P3 protein